LNILSFEDQAPRATAPFNSNSLFQSQNHFLGELGRDAFEAVEPYLLKASFCAGQVLVEAGEPVDMVYFPSSAVLSTVTILRDGRSVEGMTIGREGVAGAIGALGGAPEHAQIVCQIPGHGHKMLASVFRKEVSERPSLQQAVLRFIQRDMAQLQQMAACNASHTVNQRLARWLLLYHDRVGGPTIAATQGHLSAMLGVQRTTVTLIARQFKMAGMIRYARGNIEIVSRSGLLNLSCDCYVLGAAAVLDRRMGLLTAHGQAPASVRSRA
jgi:CRP-like cAMP-binding protein